MSDTPKTTAERYGWLSFPLLIFAASRGLLYAFAKAGPLFGPNMGVDGTAFARAYPALAALAHGEIAAYVRVARLGYVGRGDLTIPPVVPYVGKWLGAVLGSVEIGLLALSLVACAVGFAGVYRLFEKLRDAETARWGVALLAAFPLSYHLSDGSGLACLLAFSSWGVFLASRGAFLASMAVLSVGVLAHPGCALFALAALGLPTRDGQSQSPRGWRRLLVGAVPILVSLAWFAGAMARFEPTGGAGSKAAAQVSSVLGGAGGAAVVMAAGVLLGTGVLRLFTMRGLGGLALTGAAYLYLTLGDWNAFPTFALAACWPAFLGLGAVLSSRPNLRGPVVAMLCAHQGLLLYCFTHLLRTL